MTMKNKVSDWMTRQPVTIDDSASIIEAIHLMKEKNVNSPVFCVLHACGSP